MIINKKEKVIDLLLIFITIVFFYSIIYYFATFGVDAHHDGFMFKTALDLAHGKMIYRDTYSQYGALTSYIQALFILIFGERVLSIRIATVIMYVATFVINYLIWKRYVNRMSAFALNIVILFMAAYYTIEYHFLPWASVYSLFFMMLGIYCNILYVEKCKNIFLCLCAVCSFCAFLCRQPVGLVLVIGFCLMQLIFLWITPDNKKRVYKESGIYVLTLLAMILIFIVYLIINDSAEDFWIQNIAYMIEFGSTQSVDGESGFIKSLIKCLLGWVWTGEYAWGIVALISVAHFCVRVLYCVKKREVSLDDKCILMLNMYACASWHQYYPVPCMRHCYWGAFPIFGIAFYSLVSLCKIIYRGRWKGKAVVTYITAMILLLAINGQVLYYRGLGIILHSRMDYDFLENSGYDYLDGLRLSEEQIEFYGSLHRAIRSAVEETGKEVMNYSPHGYFAVFNDENYHKQYNNWGEAMYSDYEETAQKYIEEKEPVIIAAAGMDIKDYHVYFTPKGDIGQVVGETEISVYIHD